MALALMVVGVLALGYLLLRVNSLWIYRFLDRARGHDTDILPKNYEVPRYYTLKPSGAVDPSRRWPGWDGWYFFVLPDDRQIPVKMVRASLMTGLYGLEGIDTYAKLPPGASTFDVVEYLLLVPTEDTKDGRETRKNRFLQRYVPKDTSLRMRREALEVAVAGPDGFGTEAQLSGKIQGTWPHYQLHFHSPATGIKFDLRYQGEGVIWWADLPFFTYFATLGRFTGTITYAETPGTERIYDLAGRGGFEHGFARKPFNFDAFWRPIKGLQKLTPSLRPVRYHYELFLDEAALQGGFMHVRAFGITWRNRGGVCAQGSYRELHNVEVEYLDDPEPDLLPLGPGVPPAKFYRRWKVRADTAAGRLEYIGVREWPPARIASNMMYYNFSYTGTYQGKRLSGRGYGEYLHI
jgi:hypothetical protein